MNIIRNINAGELLGFFKLRRIEMRIDEDESDTEIIITFLAVLRIGDGNHPERTLLTTGIIFIAFEETA